MQPVTELCLVGNNIDIQKLRLDVKYMYVGIIISESLFQNVTPHAHIWQKSACAKKSMDRWLADAITMSW